MIMTRTTVASCLAMFLSFAACQSVQTQTVPLVEDEVPQKEMAGQQQMQPVMVGVDQPVVSDATAADTVAVIAAPVQPLKPPAPKHVYNSVDVDGPYIALTFDDGPHPVNTPKLLDTLKAKGVKATFFVIGRSVEAYPEVAKRIVAEGHEIANHSWSHPSLTKLSSAAFDREINKTIDVIERVTGVKPTTIRPPYGATNARINKRLDEEFGLKVIMWSVDPLDWKYRNSARVKNEILTKTQQGGIVLAHDIHATTVAAMAGTIDGLKAKGFRFVTVAELLKMERGLPQSSQQDTVASTQVVPAQPAATPFVVTRTSIKEPPADVR